jgi:hypothetical protein
MPNTKSPVLVVVGSLLMAMAPPVEPFSRVTLRAVGRRRQAGELAAQE